MQAPDPAETIVELARRNHADLIVLGAPPPSVIGWWRSAASSVTANAPCSVYVVRAGADDRGQTTVTIRNGVDASGRFVS